MQDADGRREGQWVEDRDAKGGWRWGNWGQRIVRHSGDRKPSQHGHTSDASMQNGGYRADDGAWKTGRGRGRRVGPQQPLGCCTSILASLDTHQGGCSDPDPDPTQPPPTPTPLGGPKC